MRILVDSLETFLETMQLVFVFSFMVLAVMLFLMGFFTYVVGGAGFIRYADIIQGNLDAMQMLVFGLVTLVSIFSLAFLSTAVTLIVKLRRSMDDVEFMKLLSHFPKYVIRLMIAWIILGAITLLIGMVFSAMALPSFLTALAMLIVWAFFIFLPQDMILHDKMFTAALIDSAKFCIKKPVAVLLYFASTFVLLFALVLIEVGIGQLKVFWLGPLFSAVILFMLVIPYLEILKTNVYTSRYKLLLSGLK